MPPLNLDDTIAAVATPPGQGGIAVVRVSGKEAHKIVSGFFRPSKKGNLAKQLSHTLRHGHFLNEEGKALDEVLVSLFRAPRSYTGEDVVEISCHGGIRIVRRVLEVLTGHGARHAEPGEFTRRAFIHGKIDLTQAEATLDLIRAQSEASLEAAVRQLQGRLSKKINQFKEKLMKLYAHLEASLDFPEEHLEVDSREECLKQLGAIEGEIRNLAASFRRGGILREGVLTVLVGKTNVGKSSLLNALLERERALVSHLPGTTRDALEEAVEIGGLAVRLVDTAGLGLGSKNELDRLGMERTRTYLQEADLLLFLVDGSSAWTAEDDAVFSEMNGKDCLPVINKGDLPPQIDLKQLARLIPQEKPCLISARTGEGLLELEKRIEEKIHTLGGMQESLSLTRARHKQALEEALAALARFRKGLQEGLSLEFVLIDLKNALDRLRELIGEIYSEDLLDVIFQEFCIGK